MSILSRKIATYSLACICAVAGFIGAYMTTGTRAADGPSTTATSQDTTLSRASTNARDRRTTTATTTTTTPTTTPTRTTTDRTTTAPTTTTTATTTTPPPTTTTPPPPTTTTPPPPTTTTRTTTDRTTTASTTTTRTTTGPSITPPPPTNSALFNGDFDAGTYVPWSAPQCHNYSNPSDNSQVHFGDFYLDNQTVGEGSYGGQFTLPAWSGGRTRCQVITSRPVNAGGDDYYSLMFYVPPGGFQPGTSSFWGVSIAELNFESLGQGGPTIALQAHTDHVTVAVQSGVATTTFPYFEYRSNADSPGSPNLPPLYAIPAPMQTGVWHELVVHAHWATNSTGAIDVWHRVKGQTTWTKTVSLSGYPTLQVNPDGSYPSTTLDVLQAYRASSSAPTTVWLDGFARWSSLAAAQALLP